MKKTTTRYCDIDIYKKQRNHVQFFSIIKNYLTNNTHLNTINVFLITIKEAR